MSDQTPVADGEDRQTQSTGTVETDASTESPPSVEELQQELEKAKQEAATYRDKFANSTREVQRLMGSRQQVQPQQGGQQQMSQPQINFDPNTGFTPEEAQRVSTLESELTEDPYNGSKTYELSRLQDKATERKAAINSLKMALTAQQWQNMQAANTSLEQKFQSLDLQNEALQATAAEIYKDPAFNFNAEQAEINSDYGPFSRRAAIAAQAMLEKQSKTTKTVKPPAPDPLAGGGKSSSSSGDTDYYRLLTADEKRLLDASQKSSTSKLSTKKLAEKMFKRLPHDEQQRRKA